MWQAHSIALLSSPVIYQKHETGRSGILLISCSNFCDANFDADFWILAKECNIYLPQFCSQCVQFVSTVIVWGSQYSANSGTVFSGHYVLGTLFSHPGYPGSALLTDVPWDINIQAPSLYNLFSLPLQNFALVQRHTKPIVHFVIKAPKLIQIYITILWTFSDIEAFEIVPVSAMVGGVQNGCHPIIYAVL